MSASSLTLDASRTALVLIDLQHGILNMPLAPRSGAAILDAAVPMVDTCRAAGIPVVLVHVGWAADFADAPPGKVDAPFPRPAGGLPPQFMQLHEALTEKADIVIKKRHWGAFHGTELDLQLRRRGIDTILLGGIATNFGVDSTARQAWERGYDVVIAEDLCTSASAELHRTAVDAIFPRIARVRAVADIAF